MQFPEKLQQKISQRVAQNSLRKLGKENSLIDFSSNDYLGFAKSEVIFNKTHQFLVDNNSKVNGATGSRLLSGNHKLYTEVEKQLAKLHNSETALVFNSGYDANIGFFASVPQRGDIILYDEFIHASIRDGIQLSNAKSFKFKHNDLTHLEELLKRVHQNDIEIYVITESVFSMDGDSPDLIAISQLINKQTNTYLVIDEAHALGVFGFGLIQKLQLENVVFARIITFGKGLGCHGAAILGSEQLQQYLVNFARSFIYTTGLSPHALATIKIAYEELTFSNSLEKLQENIQHFISESNKLQLNFIESTSAIHCCVISGNERVKNIALQLQKSGFEVKPILSPTVPLNQERLRFCLHAYNSKEEITDVLEKLATFV
ncbi:8-amino-7-oxononanoate synthase [Tenacibaculum discolor]|uniref:8-amino-7-oxononanoate synthase n=1 Tax=Tenacibaculum discolor TaxID=361581 RepID=A0A2G1BUV3_9FLAO|nr:pyridoxal phosphate-dependent aminotransferase family protein [Tenacibaculum discolor]MDP2542850.1 pyridoxal phosphate-dependent aminotransferase family protein [Tenacibaculum discolor]PHN97778.1 8-amino-7-oxononanoate synthase [Tenacibaculum discolor]PHO01873.1 8-amino-7-oxononanoate synthase [Rhodobacteraceae bacterium 4F10]